MTTGEKVIIFLDDTIHPESVSGVFLEWVTPDVAIVIDTEGDKWYSKEVYAL